MSFDSLLMMKLRTGISQELVICPRNDNDIRDQVPLIPLCANFQQVYQQSPQNRPKPKFFYISPEIGFVCPSEDDFLRELWGKS